MRVRQQNEEYFLRTLRKKKFQDPQGSTGSCVGEFEGAEDGHKEIRLGNEEA